MRYISFAADAVIKWFSGSIGSNVVKFDQLWVKRAFRRKKACLKPNQFKWLAPGNNDINDRGLNEKKTGENIHQGSTARYLAMCARRSIKQEKAAKFWKREIEKRKKAEAELKEYQKLLQELGVFNERAIESERTRIAREVHDELGSLLTVIKLDLDWLNGHISPEESEQRQKVDEMSGMVVSLIKTVQRISRDLRPGLLDDLGLASAIEWQTEEFCRRTGMRSKLFLSPDDDYKLNRELSTTIFRIFQELLTNINRHANATSLELGLFQDPQTIRLYVKDDGIGIAKQEIDGRDSFGLIGIRERLHVWNGSLTIHGSQNQGTTVNIEIPATSIPKTVQSELSQTKRRDLKQYFGLEAM